MSEPANDLKRQIRDRYARIARSPGQEAEFAVGPESAKTLGYEPEEVDALPAGVTESFCGVGNPLSLGELSAGETVLDLGSGAGMDSILAARRVGPTGRVIGVDMTAEMIDRARSNVAALGLTNVEFRQGEIEALPLDDGTVDVAISNGVFNLCPDKPRVLDEVFRVLRAGGRLLMADMILEDHVTPEKVQLMGSWSG